MKTDGKNLHRYSFPFHLPGLVNCRETGISIDNIKFWNLDGMEPYESGPWRE